MTAEAAYWNSTGTLHCAAADDGLQCYILHPMQCWGVVSHALVRNSPMLDALSHVHANSVPGSRTCPAVTCSRTRAQSLQPHVQKLLTSVPQENQGHSARWQTLLPKEAGKASVVGLGRLSNPMWAPGRGCVTVIGDALHPTQPTLAQGGCMAIVREPSLLHAHATCHCEIRWCSCLQPSTNRKTAGPAGYGS